MNSEKDTLRRRELELQRLMRQMKFDELHQSQVYRNLEQELQKIKQHFNPITEQGTLDNMNILAENQQK
jgi:hypothetical protein